MSRKTPKIVATTLILLSLCASTAYAISANCYCQFANSGSNIDAYAVTAAAGICDKVQASGCLYRDGILQDTGGASSSNSTWAQANMSASNPSGSQQF